MEIRSFQKEVSKWSHLLRAKSLRVQLDNTSRDLHQETGQDQEQPSLDGGVTPPAKGGERCLSDMGSLQIGHPELGGGLPKLPEGGQRKMVSTPPSVPAAD